MSGQLLVAIGVLAALTSSFATGCSRNLPPCSIEIAAYGPSGTREPFQIVSVRHNEFSSADRESLVEILKGDSDSRRVEQQGSRLHFDEELLGYYDNRWILSLEQRSGSLVEMPIHVMSCNGQRESVAFDFDSLGDTAWSEGTGRLVGCTLDDEWWIRSRPLFNVAAERYDYLGSTRDGFLEPTSGRFSIPVRDGLLHSVVVGKGQDPIKLFTLDGSGSNLGDLDLADSCPAS